MNSNGKNFLFSYEKSNEIAKYIYTTTKKKP